VLVAYLVFTWISTQVFAWMERRYALKGHHAR
jgi:ABC-type amino acid transport system permease subunit